MAVEVFANQPLTQVSSGGTGAPAAGTTETWTVTSPAGFPAASGTATPPAQFHVADVATGRTGEIIAVTNTAGAAWTVTRGAEGTTPVTHAPGFTVYQVVTAAALAGMLQAGNNLSDLGSAAAARASLGLGAAALLGTPVPVASGGTGQASQQAAVNALTGAQSAGKYLRSDGTNAALSAILAGDVPVLNQNTTGTASNITGTMDQVPAPAASVSLNSKKITGLANGSAAQDAAAFGQIPAALPPNGSASGDLGGTYPSPAVTATHLAAPLPLAQGGTGQAAQQAAMDALAGTQSAGKYLRSDGTHTTLAAVQAADVPAGTTSAAGVLQLDGTAADIAALGAQAAGATGKAADAGHVHPQIPLSTQPSDVGYQAWNFDPLLQALSVTFSSLPAAGSRYLARIDVHSAVTISAIWAMWIKPSGGSPANNFLALYNSSGTQVGSATSDFTATATGLQGFSIGGSQNLASGVYYVAYVCGTQGTAAGGLAWSTAVNGNAGGISSALLFGDSGHTAAKYRFAVNGTGASALPASFTLSGNSASSTYPFWCALA